MTKGLTRKITRRQALSYSRLTPNGMGVSAIAAINGRGASKRGRKKARGVATATKARYARSVKKHGRTSAHTKRAKALVKLTTKRRSVRKNRYAERGAREEMRVLRGERRFSPTELAALERGGHVRRGSQEYYSPYMAGYARKGGRVGAPDVAPRANRRRKTRKNADYTRRYKQTRALLEAPVRKNRRGRRIAGMPVVSIGEEHEWTPHVVRGRRRRRAASSEERTMKRKRKSSGGRKKRRTPAQIAATKRMLAARKAQLAGKSTKKHRGRKRKATPAQLRALAKGRRTLAARRRKGHKGRRKARKNLAYMMPNRKRSAARRKGHRRSAKKYAPISIRLGKKKVRTYMYRTKSGKVKHIPVYASAGFKSRRGVGAALRKGGKTADRYKRRISAIGRARERASNRVRLHGDIFTPNHGVVVPFETWSSSMRPNKKRRKKSAKRTRRASPRKRRKSVGTHRKAHRRSARRRGGKMTKHQRRVAAGKKAARTRRRNLLAKSGRKHGHKRKYKRNGRTAVAATPNRRHRRRRHGHHRRNARRRRSYLPMHVARMHPNRRHRRNRHRRHHHYEANFKSRDFLKRFLAMLKVGGIMAGGFVAHRIVSKAISNHVLMQVPQLAASPWRDTLGQILAGALGLFAIDAMGKGKPVAGEIGAGIFASLAHGILTTITAQAAPTYVGYLSGYADNTGRAFSEYVATSGYGGFGEYVATSGFGASPMLSQAAAGFGAPIMQAAAGYGAPIMQAAAGYGAAPTLSQAAAGVGEYVATGVQGIGDYEVVSGVGGGGSFGYEDDGIPPNLRSAEWALNVAEQAAGIGLGDIATKSQQWPMMQAKPVDEHLKGARAGTLAGSNGIFG